MRDSAHGFQGAHRRLQVRHKWRRLAAVSDTCNRTTRANLLDFALDPARISLAPVRTKSAGRAPDLCYGPALVGALRTRVSPRSAVFLGLAAAALLATVSGAT